MGTLRLKNIILLAVTLAFTLAFSESKAETTPSWQADSRLEDAILKTHWEVRGTAAGHPFSCVFEADFRIDLPPGGPIGMFLGDLMRAEVIEFSAIAGGETPGKPTDYFQVTSGKIDQEIPFVTGTWLGGEEVSIGFAFLWATPDYDRGADPYLWTTIYWSRPLGVNIRISREKLNRREYFIETFKFVGQGKAMNGSDIMTETTVTLTFEFLGCPVEIDFISGDVEIRDPSNRRITDSVMRELQIPNPEFKTVTGDDGEVTYICADKSIIRVYPGTEVDIKTLCSYPLPTKKKIHTRVFLFLGKLWIKIREIIGVDREFEIGTAGTVGSTRGTTFSVEVKRIKGKVITVYKVEQGSIWVRDKKTGETVVVEAGQTYSYIED